MLYNLYIYIKENSISYEKAYLKLLRLYLEEKKNVFIKSVVCMNERAL